MALPHRNDDSNDDYDEPLQDSTNGNDQDPIQSNGEDAENDGWFDDGDDQPEDLVDGDEGDLADASGNDAGGSGGGMIDGFNAGRDAGSDKSIKDKINDHKNPSDENEHNDDKDDSGNTTDGDSDSEGKEASDGSDKESSDDKDAAGDDKKDASDGSDGEGKKDAGEGKKDAGGKDKKDAGDGEKDADGKDKKDADGKDKKDAGDEPKSGIDKWADDSSGKMKDRTHGMIKPAEKLQEAPGLAGLPARAINGINDKGNKLLVNAADKAITGGVNAAANIAKAAVNLFKKSVRIFMRVRHVLAVIFLPPGLWVTLTIFCVITGLLRIITLTETFGPNDIDCNRTEQESKDEGSSGGAVAAGEELKTFLKDHGEAVNEVAKEYNIPAIIMIAQAGQESSWGTAGMAVPANNPWNYSAEAALESMPGYLGAGGTNSDFTVAAWDSVDHAAAGYGRFLSASSLWASAFDHANDPRAFLQALQDANYSGGAANYVELIMQISKTVEKEANAQGLELYTPTEPGNPKGSEAAKNGSSNFSSTEAEAAQLAKCDKADDGGDDGAVTGTQECDGGGCGYDWMCNSIGVCNAGDVGLRGIYPQTPYGYQCVWYAWQRLGMLHGKDGWAPVHGNGGDIWANLQGQPGWEVDLTPHPGDGVSGHGHPFAGTTHVAVIEKVESLPGGDWKVYVSEGNWCGSRGSGCWNGYHTRWMTKADILTNDNHFFRNTSWK